MPHVHSFIFGGYRFFVLALASDAAHRRSVAVAHAYLLTSDGTVRRIANDEGRGIDFMGFDDGEDALGQAVTYLRDLYGTQGTPPPSLSSFEDYVVGFPLVQGEVVVREPDAPQHEPLCPGCRRDMADVPRRVAVWTKFGLSGVVRTYWHEDCLDSRT